MTEEVSMFDSIINRIAERSETIRELRANDTGFKTKLAAALGDAAPEDTVNAAGFVAGVESLHTQLAETGLRNVDLTAQRAAAYDAERAATKRADDLLAEQQLIAEKLGLLETDDEDAFPDTAGMEQTLTPGEDQRDNGPHVRDEAANLGGQTASEIAAEIEGQAMVNDNREAAE